MHDASTAVFLFVSFVGFGAIIQERHVTRSALAAPKGIFSKRNSTNALGACTHTGWGSPDLIIGSWRVYFEAGSRALSLSKAHQH